MAAPVRFPQIQKRGDTAVGYGDRPGYQESRGIQRPRQNTGVEEMATPFVRARHVNTKPFGDNLSDAVEVTSELLPGQM